MAFYGLPHDDDAKDMFASSAWADDSDTLDLTAAQAAAARPPPTTHAAPTHPGSASAIAPLVDDDDDQPGWGAGHAAAMLANPFAPSPHAGHADGLVDPFAAPPSAPAPALTAATGSELLSPHVQAAATAALRPPAGSGAAGEPIPAATAAGRIPRIAPRDPFDASQGSTAAVASWLSMDADSTAAEGSARSTPRPTTAGPTPAAAGAASTPRAVTIHVPSGPKPMALRPAAVQPLHDPLSALGGTNDETVSNAGESESITGIQEGVTGKQISRSNSLRGEWYDRIGAVSEENDQAAHGRKLPYASSLRRWQYQIQVTNPHKVGDAISSYILYNVITTTDCPAYRQPTTVVHRRYRDFLWLYTQLAHRYPGAIVPPPPEKSALGRFADDFVESRRAALEVMLNRIAAQRLYEEDPDVVLFFQSNDFAADSRASTIAAHAAEESLYTVSAAHGADGAASSATAPGAPPGAAVTAAHGTPKTPPGAPRPDSAAAVAETPGSTSTNGGFFRALADTLRLGSIGRSASSAEATAADGVSGAPSSAAAAASGLPLSPSDLGRGAAPHGGGPQATPDPHAPNPDGTDPYLTHQFEHLQALEGQLRHLMRALEVLGRQQREARGAATDVAVSLDTLAQVPLDPVLTAHLGAVAAMVLKTHGGGGGGGGDAAALSPTAGGHSPRRPETAATAAAAAGPMPEATAAVSYPGAATAPGGSTPTTAPTPAAPSAPATTPVTELQALVVVLEEQLRLIGSARAAIAAREKIVKAWELSRAQLQRSGSPSLSVGGMAVAPAATAEPENETRRSLERQCALLARQAERATVLLKSELARVDREKVNAVAQGIKQYLRSLMEAARESMEGWTALRDTMRAEKPLPLFEDDSERALEGAA